MWIYWKEQCKYCLNREVCKHKERVIKYIEELDALDDNGVYGTTYFRCDYCIVDEEEYWKHNIGETCD